MTEDVLLTDKIVVIVGGLPEVAEATARVLATRGAAGLMICGRGAERGQALAAIISAAGCPTHFLPADLARAGLRRLITEAELVFGRIDVLIVGAGDVPTCRSRTPRPRSSISCSPPRSGPRSSFCRARSP